MLTPEPDNSFYAITRAGDLIGGIGIAPGMNRPNVGYWLGAPYWGAGYMSEVLPAAVGAFFAATGDDVLGDDVLWSGVFADNPASLAVQRKLGFEIVGEKRIGYVARGAEVTILETRLLRRRFEAQGR